MAIILYSKPNQSHKSLQPPQFWFQHHSRAPATQCLVRETETLQESPKGDSLILRFEVECPHSVLTRLLLYVINLGMAEINLFAVSQALEALRHLPGVKDVQVRIPEPYVECVVTVESFDCESCYRIYDAETEISDKFPNLPFDFRVIPS